MRPTERFTDRVADYVRYRPGYPAAIVELLTREGDLPPMTKIADVGCGAGHLAEPFLRAGVRVVGVEPNDAMRAAGQQRLDGWANFESVAGTAEATTLPDASVDAVIAGQAFHWFDPRRARDEFRRILRPPRLVALIWNERRTDGSEFLRGYEELLVRHCPEYVSVGQTHFTEADLASFFAPATMREARFPNRQDFDFPALVGRVRSSSYVPKSGPAYDRLLRDLRTLFDRTAVGGRVAFEYDTRVFYARFA